MGARLINVNRTPLVKLTSGCGHWGFERRSHPLEDRNGKSGIRALSPALAFANLANLHDPPQIGALLDSRPKSRGIIFLTIRRSSAWHRVAPCRLPDCSDCVFLRGPAPPIRGPDTAAFLPPREEPFGNVCRAGVHRRQGSFPRSAVSSR